MEWSNEQRRKHFLFFSLSATCFVTKSTFCFFMVNVAFGLMHVSSTSFILIVLHTMIMHSQKQNLMWHVVVVVVVIFSFALPPGLILLHFKWVFVSSSVLPPIYIINFATEYDIQSFKLLIPSCGIFFYSLFLFFIFHARPVFTYFTIIHIDKDIRLCNTQFS